MTCYHKITKITNKYNRRALEALDCHTHQGWNTLLKGIQDAKILQQAIIM